MLQNKGAHGAMKLQMQRYRRFSTLRLLPVFPSGRKLMKLRGLAAVLVHSALNLFRPRSL